jgi:hypothetical protein
MFHFCYGSAPMHAARHLMGEMCSTVATLSLGPFYPQALLSLGLDATCNGNHLISPNVFQIFGTERCLNRVLLSLAHWASHEAQHASGWHQHGMIHGVVAIPIKRFR